MKIDVKRVLILSFNYKLNGTEHSEFTANLYGPPSRH